MILVQSAPKVAYKDIISKPVEVPILTKEISKISQVNLNPVFLSDIVKKKEIHYQTPSRDTKPPSWKIEIDNEPPPKIVIQKEITPVKQ